jgi:S-layer family protein/phosphate-selective porin O/P
MRQRRCGSLALRSVAGGVCFLLAMAAVAPVRAQDAPPDVPPGHWAYEAVRDLANKGLVMGYPDGKFMGKRALTRYEMATIIQRLLRTVDAMVKAATPPPTTPPAPPPPPPPPPKGVTQDDLNKIQVLVDQFRTELTAIQADLKQAIDDIDALREDVLQTKEMAAKAQEAANNSYGSSASRKFSITGYIQGRYQQPDTSSRTRFPEGVPANTGANQYNGNYAQAGNRQTWTVRRARIKFAGQPGSNTKYGIQVDTAGAINATNQQVTVREGYLSYTFGNGDAVRFPTITAGLWANFYGFQLPLSSSQILSPERPLAFNEGSNSLWPNQDYERGVSLKYPFGPFSFAAAVVNGTGLNSNDIDRHMDGIFRAAWQTKSKIVGIGASYYTGQIPGSGVGLGNPAANPPIAPYQSGDKDLWGVDAQYGTARLLGQQSGPFVLGEYVAGKFERRTYFDNTVAGGLAPVTTNPAPGNRVEGYYGQIGYTLNGGTKHPLTLGFSYDLFRRSKSGVAAGTPGGESGDSFDDENIGGGALYNLDSAIRLRLWYEKPQKVAHAAGQPSPPKIGLFTAELQVRF